MTADEHNRTLATLWFIYGAMHGLTLLGLLLLILVVKLSVSEAIAIYWFWIAISVVTFLVLLLVAGMLPLLVGFGFRKRSRWLKPSAQALAIVSLVNVPIGTALGIYTIKFFRSDAGVGLYGGKPASATEDDLKEAMGGAQPLINWANRSK